MTRTARTICLIAAPAIIVAVASTAHGHARLKSPAPRDNQDGYKDPPRTPPGTGAPCGISEAASQPHTTLTPGMALNVTWEETVTHPGCFVIDFSPANDANFTVLGVKSHMNAPAPANPTGTNPRQWSLSVTLPTTPCPKCTLRVRQLMLTSDVADSGCPPATIPAGATYYSCANIALGTGGAGGSGGGAGGTAGTAGRGGNAGGGRGGSAAGGRGGGAGGSSAAGQAGTSGQAGDNGQAGSSGQAGSGSSGSSGSAGAAGTSGQAGSGSSGEAGTSGQTGSGGSGSSGQAGTSGQAGSGSTGQAGNGSSGAAGSSPAGTGGSNGDGGGGCQIGGGTTPAPLGLLLALALIRRRRRRSRS